MNNKRTCGPMYKDAIEKYAGDDPEKVRIFAAGFVSGQAEKVYMGACRAAMFYPSQDCYGMLIETVNDVAARYSLWVVSNIGTAREIWICQPSIREKLVGLLQGCAENSPEWHLRRAWLCGVPADEIDLQFHLRSGHGERCD